MNARQARLSVESMREVMNDKTLKTRGIKEGRLREKQQNNTKKFMEERKVAQMIQNREKEKLKLIHEKQLEEVQKEMNGVSNEKWSSRIYKIDYCKEKLTILSIILIIL